LGAFDRIRVIAREGSILIERMELAMSKVLVVATVLAATFSWGAFAQDAARDKAGITPLAPDGRSMPLQAPVGHRQPRISDLPATPRSDEDKAAARSRADTDSKLRICRGC
jgi:hypothetical protein